MTSRGRSDRLVSRSAQFVATSMTLFLIGALLHGTEAFAREDALAEVDGETIKSDEIAKFVGAPLGKLEEQIYILKRRALDALIADKLMTKDATKRGISVQTLLEAEIQTVEAVGEAEVEVAFRQQKAQLKVDEATAKEQIRQQLQAMKIAARQRAFVDQLRAQSVVVVNLKPPAPLGST